MLDTHLTHPETRSLVWKTLLFNNAKKTRQKKTPPKRVDAFVGQNTDRKGKEKGRSNRHGTLQAASSTVNTPFAVAGTERLLEPETAAKVARTRSSATQDNPTQWVGRAFF